MTLTEGRWKALGPVLAGLAEVPANLRVSDITQDSREVSSGSAFLACRGHSHHGLEYAPRAAAAGARVILWESAPGVAPPALDESIVVREVPALRAQLGLIADRFFDSPSARLKIAAVTGTNGKTTCAWLLAQALTLLGGRAAYLGTLGVGAPGALESLTHTTPDAITLHRLLARLLERGFDTLAMEISSHALAQDRAAGVRLHSAAFTNLTRDHLDYHGDMTRYGEAKAKLFAWPQLRARVFNIDDAFGRLLAERYRPLTRAADAASAPAASLWLTSRQARPATAANEYVFARQLALTADGLELEVDSSRGSGRIQSALRGAFNAENLLTCLAVLLAWEVPLDRACATLARCAPAPGRLQPEGGAGLPLVLIDYAHTPDALSAALAAARAHCRGRLWCVFGCGGERDVGKRAQMGRIAAEAADELIVTDDNPRGEDPAQIVAAILQGVQSASRTTPTRVLHHRAQAIGRALEEAVADDVVLVAGKGHEDYQIVGAERRAFSDAECVRAALTARAPLAASMRAAHA